MRRGDHFISSRVGTTYGERVGASYVPSVLNYLPISVLSLGARKDVKSLIFDLYA